MMRKDKFIITKHGLPLGCDKIETLEDADVLRNNLYQSGHYGVMSKCMASGMNSGWDNGVCNIYRIDKSECTCHKDWHEEFERILQSENN